MKSPTDTNNTAGSDCQKRLVRPLCRVCGQQILSPSLHPCGVDHPERVREIRKLEAIREKTGGDPEMDRTISTLRDEIGWTNA